MIATTEAIVAVVHALIRKNITAARGRELGPEVDLRADLQANDLDVLQLVMDIEDARNIEVTDEEAEAIRTVGDAENIACTKIPFEGVPA